MPDGDNGAAFGNSGKRCSVESDAVFECKFSFSKVGCAFLRNLRERCSVDNIIAFLIVKKVDDMGV